MKKFALIAAVTAGLVGVASAATIFEATTGNTTLFNNAFNETGSLTLSEVQGALVVTNSHGLLNSGGFSSTENINTLNGTPLTDIDTVSMKVTIDTFSGDLRGDGVLFGMGGSAVWPAGTTNNLLFGVEAANSGSDVRLRFSWLTDGNLGFDAQQASVLDGFSMEIVANAAGYTFTISDIIVQNSSVSGINNGDTSATITDSFAAGVFVDFFGNGHFKYAAQKYNTGPLVSTISAASIDVFVQEPELKIAPNSLSLELLASDTSTNRSLVASYIEGTLSSADVEVVSLVADAGFGATPGSFTLGTVNTNQDITVTFDNSSIGLSDDGDTTNSTLIITWTEAGSGVTNTTEVALDITYIDEPSSLSLVPAALALQLNGPAESIDGSIVASFVAGTFPTDVEVVSLDADAGFSAAPGSFTLGTVNTDEDITVTFDNSSIGLSNTGDSTNSTLIITWTEAGSGVTNTSEAALSVSYVAEPAVIDPADIIFEATTNNTTLVGNRNPIVGSITGTPGALQINNTGGSFDNMGFASTDTINTMNGEALTTNDTVTFKATITGITGLIRANGVEFGMSPTAVFREDDNLVYAMKADNALHAFQANALQDAGNLTGRSSEASMKDGFDITLVVNADGYTFTINDIVNSADGNATTIIESGEFAGNEFLDHFSDGHFYLAIQQFNVAADTIMSISEAFIAVESFVAEQPVILGTSVSDGNFNLAFTGTVGKEYAVESSDNLTIADNWDTVTNFTLPETPMTVSWPTTNNAIFYRVFIP